MLRISPGSRKFALCVRLRRVTMLAMFPRGISKQRTALIAVVLIVAMCGLGLHVALHWHAEACADQVCQACHAGHTAMPQPVALLVDGTVTAVQRFVAAEAPAAVVAPVRTNRIPRAPPA
jgi:hypothetical protein